MSFEKNKFKESAYNPLSYQKTSVPNHPLKMDSKTNKRTLRSLGSIKRLAGDGEEKKMGPLGHSVKKGFVHHCKTNANILSMTPKAYALIYMPKMT